MFSYIFIFCTSIILLYPKQEKEKVNNYSLIFTSLTFAHFLLGTISLFLVMLNLSKLSTFIISLFIFIISLIFLKISSKKKIKHIYKLLNEEFNLNILKNKSFLYKKTFLLGLILLVLIFLSSIGPINHPDAADYHLGYPYQYFLRGRFFIDGGLHQGLLGIADYANLAFIQEKTIWLIRPLQILSLPFLILFLNKRIHNKIFIIIILTCPLLIQYSTVGKPLFLSESCLTCLYLIWKEEKTYTNFKFLIISIIVATSTKSSSLLISLPILLNLIIESIPKNINNTKSICYFNQIKFDKVIIFSVFSFLVLLYSRFLISGNFAYPFLTNIFNSDNFQFNQFSEYIKDYGRDEFFPLNIFLPFKLSSLSIVVGFPLSLIIIYSIYLMIKNYRKIFKNTIFNVFLAQMILLICFCQGRGYYYLSPIILIVSQLDDLKYDLLNKNFKTIFLFSLWSQSFILLTYLFFSIYQNLYGLIDYESLMNRSSYGYSTAKLIEENSQGNNLFLDRNTRLFYNFDYVDADNFIDCIYSKNKEDIKNRDMNLVYQYCLDKLDVTRVISAEDSFFLDKDKFFCDYRNSYNVTRNPFRRKKTKYLICEMND